jgi:hypothetical protein
MNKSHTNKDLELKFLCKILYKEMGYYTHYEIKLRTKSYIETIKSHDISDIDVFGYTFLPDLTCHCLGAECKSGETNALDELYKFIGVIDYFCIDKGYFIKSKIHQNARQVAAQTGISCYTEAELRKLLLGFGYDVDKQIKIESAIYYRLIKAIKSQEKFYERLINYIQYDFWNKENWRNIHNFIHLLSKNIQGELFPAVDLNRKMFFYYIAELFSIAILKNLNKAMLESFSDIESSIRNQMFGGGESLSEKRKVYDLVNQATNQNLTFAPEWEDDFVKMSSRFANHTCHSAKLPLFFQELREQSFYQSKLQIKQKSLKIFDDITRKFAQDLLQFLIKHTTIGDIIYKEIMKL